MNRFFLAASCLVAVACAEGMDVPALDDAADLSASRAFTEGTPEVQGMLQFLNDGGTTFEVLDVDVALDKRAARSIVDYRNGPDRVFGTADDRSYETVEEVDRRYYVGPAALDRIAAFAWDQGWVPSEPDDLLGTWDEVTFTVAEAEAVVELSNTAGPNTLDIEWGMDARAVDSIVAARPIETVAELAGLYYVGTSALTTLKDQAGTSELCEVPGWQTIYVRADDSGQWRSQLPEGLALLVDDLVERTDWCDDGYLEPWFVKATIDRFNCEDKGYTVELGQPMDEYHGVIWYIEFEVDLEFDTDGAICEV